MTAVRADAKKRIVIPGASPGDVFDVQREGDERYVLVRLHRPEDTPVKSRAACLDAMGEAPLTPALTWEQLRHLTRDP